MQDIYTNESLFVNTEFLWLTTLLRSPPNQYILHWRVHLHGLDIRDTYTNSIINEFFVVVVFLTHKIDRIRSHMQLKQYKKCIYMVWTLIERHPMMMEINQS